jgi:bacterioferritin
MVQGEARIIEALNARLTEELTAINQYMVHAEMCENWRYSRIADPVEKRAIVEMRHAEKLIERILYLEGQPIVSNLNQIRIGSNVPDMHRNDLDAERMAVQAYNESIALAAELKDDGTKQLLQAILKEEEEHVDWLEAQLDQVEQMGVENYLSVQID